MFCTSASNCWAVGDETTKLGRLNQVLHWTGKQWFKVAVPEPGGTGQGSDNELDAVRCTSAKNTPDPAGRWNGAKWVSS